MILGNHRGLPLLDRLLFVCYKKHVVNCVTPMPDHGMALLKGGK